LETLTDSSDGFSTTALPYHTNITLEKEIEEEEEAEGGR